MKVAGVYEIVYQNISDPSGNNAESVTRWVRVYDEDAPLLTLYGANPMYVDLNSTNEFKDPGAFGLDNLEGFIDWETNRFEISVEKLWMMMHTHGLQQNQLLKKLCVPGNYKIAWMLLFVLHIR